MNSSNPMMTISPPSSSSLSLNRNPSNKHHHHYQKNDISNKTHSENQKKYSDMDKNKGL